MDKWMDDIANTYTNMYIMCIYIYVCVCVHSIGDCYGDIPAECSGWHLVSLCPYQAVLDDLLTEFLMINGYLSTICWCCLKVYASVFEHSLLILNDSRVF